MTPRRDDPDFAAEIRSHLEHEVDRQVAAGLTPEAARASARRKFGNLTQHRERFFFSRQLLLDRMRLRLTLRRLGRAPLFTGTVVVILALAVAAATLVLDATYLVAWRPLPFRDPRAVVQVWATDGEHAESRDVFDAPTLRAWRAQPVSFSEFSVYEDVTLLAGSHVIGKFPAARVDGNFFAVFGVAPRLGRPIVTGDDAAGALPVMVLSDHLWRTAFAGQADAIGSTWRLNTTVYTVVGVMPPTSEIPGGQAWISAPGRETGEAKGYYIGIGRLRPGVTAAQAQAQLAAIMPRSPGSDTLGPAHPGALVEPLSSALRRTTRTLALLSGAMVLLCAVAIANLGTLFLVRALNRAKEMAIGVALGASSGRMRFDSMLEGGVIGLAAALLGLCIAAWLRTTLDAFISNDVIQRAETLPLTAPIVALSIVAAVTTGVLLAASTQRMTGRMNLVASLRGGGAGAHIGRVQRTWRQALVCLQVASAVIACLAATALIRSSQYVAHIDVGYDANRVVVVPMDIWNTDYGTPLRARQLIDRIDADLASTPGVTSSAIWATAGFSISTGGPDDVYMIAEGSPLRMSARNCSFASCAYVVHPVSTGLFATFRIPLQAGRVFTSTDRAGGIPVAIVNQQAAAVWWPGQSAVGRRIRLGGINSNAPWLTVVGVVGNIAPLNALGRMPRALKRSNIQPLIFEPLAQAHLDEPFIADDPLFIGIPATPTIRAASRDLDRVLSRDAPDLPVPRATTMRTFLDSDTIAGALKLPTAISTAVTAISLILTVLGIVGVTAQSVRYRTREIGIRLALGATSASIVRLICGDAIKWLMAGALAGGAATLLFRSAIARMAFQANRSNPDGMLLFGSIHPTAALTVITPAILLVGLAAAYLPARMASRLDPLGALRIGND